MRQRFIHKTRTHRRRDSHTAEPETTQYPAAHEHLQQEIEQMLEVIDEVLEENSNLDLA